MYPIKTCLLIPLYTMKYGFNEFKLTFVSIYNALRIILHLLNMEHLCHKKKSMQPPTAVKTCTD